MVEVGAETSGSGVVDSAADEVVVEEVAASEVVASDVVEVDSADASDVVSAGGEVES